MSLRNFIILFNAAALVFLVGVAYAAVRARRERATTAPNRTPYHDDEGLEGPRLERMLGWALAFVAVSAAALPTYWLLEPSRQERMEERFLETSIERGAELFSPVGSNLVALGCADCHGPKGEGGFAPQNVTIDREELTVAPGALDSADRRCAPLPDDDTKLLCQVAWKAPSLDDVLFRFSRDELTQIITYGRPGTPMPSWGVAGGGAKNEQSISNIVDFIESIQISKQEAMKKLAGVTDGKQLFEASCARCHTKHWSYIDSFARMADIDVTYVPGGGAFGPNLAGGATLRQFPKLDDHLQFILTGSDFQKPYGVRGIGSGRMPGFGSLLTEAQAKAIAEYERSLDGQPVTETNEASGGGGAPDTTTTTAGGGA